MAKRYRRRSYSNWEPTWPPREPEPPKPIQSWAGRYEDAYRAPEVWEPDYRNYVYRSKLSEGWNRWLISEIGNIEASYITTDQVADFLCSSAIENPLRTDQSNFSAPPPSKPSFPPAPVDPTTSVQVTKPTLEPLPPKPVRPIASAVSFGFLDKPLGSIARTMTRGRQKELDEKYEPILREWQKKTDEITERNDRTLQNYESKVKRLTTGSPEYAEFLRAREYWEDNRNLLERRFEEAQRNWQEQKRRFDVASKEDASTIASLKSDVKAGFTDAIEFVASTALRISSFQSKTPTVHYDKESKILLVQFVLPDFERLQIVEPSKLKPLQGKRLAQQTDIASVSLILRACYDFAQIFEGSPVEALALNTEVTFIDPSTGHERTEIVASLFARLEELRALRIASVDPKAAFRALKGVSSGDLSKNSPVPPIYSYDKKDSRIVEGREVISGLAADSNLAAMHWEEFEHLIRQLFELEFAANGSEVKVTRASHDSGVDAIVFDPDPIRGGKIVIQAKRYVNTVDASAVRDLYGTVQSEGANKGILITTSSYGPESYEFSKNKPITLLNGENLLWLLKKHGHDFSIDLQAARQILKEKGWL